MPCGSSPVGMMRSNWLADAERGDLGALHCGWPIGDDRAATAVGCEEARGIGAGGDLRRMPAIDLDQGGDRRRIGRKSEVFERTIEDLSPHTLLEQGPARTGNHHIPMQSA